MSFGPQVAFHTSKSKYVEVEGSDRTTINPFLCTVIEQQQITATKQMKKQSKNQRTKGEKHARMV